MNTEKVNEIREYIRQKNKELQEEVKKMFSEGATEVFSKHPSLESFGWKQYTCYFNDGDTCYFSAYTYCPEINGEDNIEEEGVLGGKLYPGVNVELVPLKDDVMEFLGAFEDEDFKAMFGDHVSVTVLRDGSVNIDKYTDHD